METSQEKIDLFNKYLVDFQDDISRIVSRYRKSYHAHSVEELISDVNIALIKKSEDLIHSEESVLLSFDNFKKVAYAFCKNSVVWSHKGADYKTKKYLENKSDRLIKDSEGDFKSLFEFMCENAGEDDEGFLKLNESDKFQTIIKWVFDYSHFLSPNQKNILQFILSGKKQDEIAEIIGITDQAVSDSLINAYRNIQSNIKIDVFSDSSDGDRIAEGFESVKYIFGRDRVINRKMSPDFCRKIKKLLEENPKKYTLDDLCEITGNEYTKKQICVIINYSKHCKFLKN